MATAGNAFGEEWSHEELCKGEQPRPRDVVVVVVEVSEEVEVADEGETMPEVAPGDESEVVEVEFVR